MRHIWLKIIKKEYEQGRILEESNLHSTVYPVRNNARCSVAGLDFRIMMVGFNAPLFSNPFPVKDRQRGGTCLREATLAYQRTCSASRSAKAGGRFSEDMYFQLWTPWQDMGSVPLKYCANKGDNDPNEISSVELNPQ